MRVWLYTAFIIPAAFSLNSQTDPAPKRSDFALKKFYINAELGRSPTSVSNYTYNGIGTVRKPYWKLGFTYNARIPNNCYFVGGLGLSWEEYRELDNGTRTTSFLYNDTSSVARIGNIVEYAGGSYDFKNLYLDIDMGIQWLCSPFEYDDMKFGILGSVSARPHLFTEKIGQTGYQKDSITIYRNYILRSENIHEDNKSAIALTRPMDLNLNLSPRIIFNYKYLQCQTGFNFTLQFTSPNPYLLQYKAGILTRIYFSIGF